MHLLEWMTSEEAEKQAKTDIISYYKQMIVNIIAGVIAILLCFLNNIWGTALGILWIITPYIMQAISKEIISKNPKDIITEEENSYLLEIANRQLSRR